ncbi:unnamed protein product [Boreogadus saida]
MQQTPVHLMSVLGVLWGVSALFFSNLLRGGPWQVLVIVATALVGVATAWMRDSEEGLLDVDSLVRTHGHSCSWFLGPFYHLVRVFHPDFTNPLLKAAAFHFDVLKGYVAVFNNATHTMHSKWMRLSSEGQRDLEMFQHVGLMTLDSLLRCAFSHSSDCQETSNEFTTAILELGDLIMDRRRTIPHHWDCIYWRSAQGKRFRRATEVVHRYGRREVPGSETQRQQPPCQKAP